MVMTNKRYISPVMHVEQFNTRDLMKISSDSGLPIGMMPQRRSDRVF